jgi:hypothetical protein
MYLQLAMNAGQNEPQRTPRTQRSKFKNSSFILPNFALKMTFSWMGEQLRLNRITEKRYSARQVMAFFPKSAALRLALVII